MERLNNTNDDFDYIIYTDGGCISNPGGIGACASVIIDTNTGEINEVVNGYCSSTNNRMEVRAIIQALEIIPTHTSVFIYSDSQYAINCAKRIWERKKNQDLWEIYNNVSKNKNIEFQWVKGHNGNLMNERCDHLCTEKMLEKNLFVDSGYLSEISNVPKTSSHTSEFLKKYPGGSMTVSINCPSDVQKYFDKDKSCRSAKDSCLKIINILNNQKNPSFKNYVQLKTGGIDNWSKVSKKDLIELCGEKEYKFISSFFDTENHQLSAVKWYARGLSIDKAIRKELVSLEIESNIIYH